MTPALAADNLIRMSEEQDAPPGADAEVETQAKPTHLGEKGDAAFEAAFAAMDTQDDEADLHVASASKAGKKKSDDPEDDEGEPARETAADDDELDEDADEDATQASDDDAEPDEDEDDEDMALHRAYTVLHDAKVPSSVLKNTPKKKLVAWAAEVVERAKSAAETGASKSETDSDTSTSANGAGEPAQASPAAAWAARRSVIAEKLGIDEEAADAFKPLHDENESLRAEVKALHSKFESAEAAARAREGQATIDMQLRRLEGAGYAGLGKDASLREKITDEAVTIAEGLKARGKPVDPVKVFDQAARTVKGEPKRGDLKNLRRNGTSTPPGLRGGQTAEPETENEFWQRATDYYDAGKPELAARLKPPPIQRRSRQRW